MSILMSWGRQHFVDRVNRERAKATTMANGSENLSSIWEEFIKKVLNMTHSSIDIGPL